MRHKLATLFFAGLISLPSSVLANDLDEVLERAANFLGGEENLMSLEQIEIMSTGMRQVLDEGFVPGPSGRGTFDMMLQWGLRREQLRIDYDIETPAFGVSRSVVEMVNGLDGFTDGQDGNFRPTGVFAMSSDRVESIKRHQRLLNPQVILRELLRDQGDAWLVRHHSSEHVKQFDRSPYDRVRIKDDVANITLLIRRDTGEIASLRTRTSDLLRRDVPIIITYSNWESFGNSVRFPMQVAIRHDGGLVHHELRLAVRAGTDLFTGDQFAIPSSLEADRDRPLRKRGQGQHQTLQSMAAFGFPQDGLQLNVVSTELTPGVWFLGGASHNSLAVKRNNGVVIVEAPLGPERSRAILDWVKNEIGGRVTHVVASHHHVDHASGVRELAGNGARVVAHESARQLWKDVLSSPSRILGDALDREEWRSHARLMTYGDLIVLEDSSIPVRAFPYDQTHSADSVLVEAGGVIFVVDTYSPGAGPPPPDVGQAIVEAVNAQGLTPSFIAGGHGSFIPWSDFLAGLP